MFVRIDCDRDELFKRAHNRGYTTPERLTQIDQQLAKMHLHGMYDVTINTSTNTTEENADIIKRALVKRSEWKAFKQLKPIFDRERNNNR